MPRRGQKVVVAMSGGVDSSVAAALLLEQGYEVVGCFMRLGSEDSVERLEESEVESGRACVPGKQHHQGCCSLNDASDARMVAALLGVPFYVLNFKKDFGRIIDYFVGEYNAGRTPNPCVRCNDWLKFGKLMQYARSIDADYVATGHYARVDHRGQGPRLLRGVDEQKDQSYVLFGTRLESLGRMLLPIGEYQKSQIRQMARERNLPVFNKPDSQEICFVPDNDYAGLVRRRTPAEVAAGQVVDTQGRVLGEHRGHQHYTIGQRRGLPVAVGVPLYVLQKDASANTITVGTRGQLRSAGLQAAECNWLIDPPTGEPVACQVSIRSHATPAPARMRVTGEGKMEVWFESPQDAVSPGQAAVCYQGEQLIGGGWITRALGETW